MEQELALQLRQFSILMPMTQITAPIINFGVNQRSLLKAKMFPNHLTGLRVDLSLNQLQGTKNQL